MNKLELRGGAGTRRQDTDTEDETEHEHEHSGVTLYDKPISPLMPQSPYMRQSNEYSDKYGSEWRSPLSTPS